MFLPKIKDWLRFFLLTWGRFRRGELRWVDTAYGNSTSFSQFGEDSFLRALFSNVTTGYYVDVGAFHPFYISNTYLFYKQGWHGINIEPNPDHFRFFPVHRPKDVNINAAVSTRAGKVQFSCAGAFSGIDDDTHLYRGVVQSTQVEVEAIPLREILDAHLPSGQSIDFLSVDCEGHDLEVLKSNDWDRYRPKVILVEDHGQREDISPKAFLESVGYQLTHELQITKVFLDRRVSSAFHS